MWKKPNLCISSSVGAVILANLLAETGSANSKGTSASRVQMNILFAAKLRFINTSPDFIKNSA